MCALSAGFEPRRTVSEPTLDTLRQRRDLQVGIVLPPEEAFENEHFVARGMQVTVHHDEVLGRNL